MARAWVGVTLAAATVGGARAGIIVYYPFDGNAADLSGNGNHATVTGNIGWVAGEHDGAMFVNNPQAETLANQFVTLPNSLSILSLGESSFSFAIKYKTTDTSNGRLFGAATGVIGSATGMALTYSGGGTDTYGFVAGDEAGVKYGHAGTPNDPGIPSAITTDGLWHWVVVVHDRDAKTIDYYVDEQMITSHENITLGTVSFSDLTIGKYNGPISTDAWYSARNTSVDEFRLYSHAIEPMDVYLPVPELAGSTRSVSMLLGLAGFLRWRRGDNAKRRSP